MKKLRHFEIEAIREEAFKLIKEDRVKQVQSKFDESEEKEQLLDLLPQINDLNERINKLSVELDIFTTKENKLKETLRGKGVIFWRGDNKEYTLEPTGVVGVYDKIKHEIILNGIDNGNNVREFIKELVDKFK
jgi:hypothetical protein